MMQSSVFSSAGFFIIDKLLSYHRPHFRNVRVDKASLYRSGGISFTGFSLLTQVTFILTIVFKTTIFFAVAFDEKETFYQRDSILQGDDECRKYGMI
jgi:hypothetical protein